jgi:hypothetical protein
MVAPRSNPGRSGRSRGLREISFIEQGRFYAIPNETFYVCVDTRKKTRQETHFDAEAALKQTP